MSVNPNTVGDKRRKYGKVAVSDSCANTEIRPKCKYCTGYKFPHIQKDTERHLNKMSCIKCFSSIALVWSPQHKHCNTFRLDERSEVTLRTFMLHRCERGAMAARERHGSNNRINTKARAKKTRVKNQKRNLWCNTFLRMCFHFAILQKMTNFPIWQHPSPHEWTYFHLDWWKELSSWKFQISARLAQWIC